MRRLTAVLALVLLFAAPTLGGVGEVMAQRSAPSVAIVPTVADTLVLARIEAGLQAGNPSALLADAADPVDIAIFGHGATYSRSQAALVLTDFFRRYPPEQVTLREEVAAEDRRSVIGHYREAGASEASAVFVRLRSRDGRWEIRSIRIERLGRH